jgi:hypothetical protein
MRNLLETVRSAFSNRSLAAPPVEDARRQTDRQVVMQRTRGNLPIQFGDYVTKSDLQREYEEFKKIDFDAD